MLLLKDMTAYIHNICLTLTLFDDLCLHMSEVMKVLQGKAAPVSSGSNGIYTTFTAAGRQMKMVLKFTGGELVAWAAQHSYSIPGIRYNIYK